MQKLHGVAFARIRAKHISRLKKKPNGLSLSKQPLGLITKSQLHFGNMVAAPNS